MCKAMQFVLIPLFIAILCLQNGVDAFMMKHKTNHHFPGSTQEELCSPSGSCGPPLHLQATFPTAGSNSSFVFVAVTNGVSLLRVSSLNETDARPAVEEVNFFRGCLNTRRALWVANNTLYAVHGPHELCSCVKGPCNKSLFIPGAGSLKLDPSYPFIDLSCGQPIRTNYDAPLKPLQAGTSGCFSLWDSPPGDYAGKIVVARYDPKCSLGEMLSFLQSARALAVLVINSRDDLLFTASLPDKKFSLAVMLLQHSHGMALWKNLTHESHPEIWAKIDPIIPTDSPSPSPPFRSPSPTSSLPPSASKPNGLWAINIDEPENAYLAYTSISYFHFAESLFAEPIRPYLYVSGPSCLSDPGQSAGNSCHGGFVVFDISNPTMPLMVSEWSQERVSSVRVERLLGSYLLFATSLSGEVIYVVDVSDPTELSQSAIHFHVSEPVSTAHPSPDGLLLFTPRSRGPEVLIWNMTNPLRNTLLGVTPPSGSGGGSSIFVQQGALWVASPSTQEVSLYNVTSPGDPLLLGSFQVGVNGSNASWPQPPDLSWSLSPASDSRYLWVSDAVGFIHLLEYLGKPIDGSVRPTADPPLNSSPPPPPPSHFQDFQLVLALGGVGAFAVGGFMMLVCYFIITKTDAPAGYTRVGPSPPSGTPEDPIELSPRWQGHRTQQTVAGAV